MAKLFIVGMGPGAYEQMTLEAVRVIQKSQVVVGYHVYTDLLRDCFPDKEYLSTPMRAERERCVLALKLAREGRRVALVCSGDAGVYGMSGLLLSMVKDYEGVELINVPGVTAALAGAALLGAPLIHDFCLISLSDLLTPWSLIAQRLNMAALGDFSIVLYNPSSKKRGNHLKMACEILLKEKSPQTPCGIVTRAYRRGQSLTYYTLEELQEAPCDMFSTVFIGNSQTRMEQGKLLTPRGYKDA